MSSLVRLSGTSGASGGSSGGLTLNTQTGSYTLALSDASNVVVNINSSSAATVTVPTNAAVGFPVGTAIEVRRGGTGMVAILAASGVTLEALAGLVARARYSQITLLKTGTNTWWVTGDVADRNVDPLWTVGLNSNADPLNQAPRAADLGCPVLRVEFAYSDSVATLKPVIDLCASLGIRVQPLAGWDNGISVPDLSNVVSWATAFGPGGSNWPGGSSPYAILNIELGNENSFGYKSGTVGGSGYNTIAQSYGTRVLAVQNALAATGTPVKTLVELEDGSSGNSAWITNVVSTGGSALLANMGGPAIHAYGPDWETKVNRNAGFLATAGSTARYYVTETGLATDNGATLDDNYGYATNLTYDQAATTLTTQLAGMKANSHIRQVLIYEVADLQPTGAATGRESYFGVLSNSGGPKGALTPAARALLASSYVDAFSF